MKVLNQEKLDRMAEYIKGYMRANNGEAPKFGEILAYMDMSKSVGYRYLTRLKEQGIIEYSGKGTLSMEGRSLRRYNSVRVPIVGNVICGSPEEEEEYAEGFLAIPEEWVQGECFLLRAYGDSMVDAGVEAGDLILVKKTSEATDGQIVVALTENGNTLKRIFWENGRPRLHAENKSYSAQQRDIYPKELSIQGVALKLIKDF